MCVLSYYPCVPCPSPPKCILSYVNRGLGVVIVGCTRALAFPPYTMLFPPPLSCPCRSTFPSSMLSNMYSPNRDLVQATIYHLHFAPTYLCPTLALISYVVCLLSSLLFLQYVLCPLSHIYVTCSFNRVLPCPCSHVFMHLLHI